VPAFANGTDYHLGGPAILHENEMVNLPRGTGVSTAAEVRTNAEAQRRMVQILEKAEARLAEIQDDARRTRQVTEQTYEDAQT
jgi:hypothetical protein